MLRIFVKIMIRQFIQIIIMISDSCVQNAKEKILFNVPNYSA